MTLGRAGTNASGSDLAEVWAFDSSSATRQRLADLPEARFDLQLVGLPDGDVLAIGGGQHVNRTEVLIPLPYSYLNVSCE